MTSNGGTFEKEKTTYTENIIMLNENAQLGKSEQAAVDYVLDNNRAVGIVIGTYDDARTISMASNFFLTNLGYNLEEYAHDRSHSLLTYINEEDRELFEREDFIDFEGEFEFRLVNKNGDNLYTYGYKTNCVSATGEQQWVISARVSRETVATHELIRGLDRLVVRYVICDVKKDTYSFFVCGDDESYMTRGIYDRFIDGMQAELGLTERLEEFDAAMKPQTVVAQLKTWDGLYRYDYADAAHNIYYRLSVMPIEFDEAELTKYLVLIMDVTQTHREEMLTKQALADACEAANRASEAKTQFLSNMSHDIRTPMNAIIGMTAIATAHIDDKDRVLDALGKITVSSRHLLALINEVLDMNRIERGKMALNDEDFSLPELIDNMVEMVKPQLLSAEQTFEIRVHDIEHELVSGDSLRIQQVFTNVVGNAVKYTPDGGTITLDISEKATHHAGVGCYEFVISDTGIGMDAEYLEHIFEPFTRAENATNAGVQGTGLGMPIAKNIVSMMNGTINVESELNVGTTVTITIFLRLQEETEVTDSQIADLPVLVVDDDVATCESTVDTLVSIGMKGEWVSNGKDAVERVDVRHQEDDDFFAVIVDWKMPEMDGIQTAREIRKRVGDDTPIIMLTSYDFSEIEQEAREAGITVFVSKPLFRSRLKNVFMRLTSSSQASPEQQSVVPLPSGGSYEGKRVLVVEDNLLNREIMVDILTETGVEIETAVNGKIAVDMVSENPEGYYDLVFMDIQMPVMNGYEATMAIRSLSDGKGALLPIVALTANAFAEDVVMAKNAGVNEHLAKPVDLARLGEVMQTWLG